MATKATEKPVRREVSGQSHGALVVGVTEHYLTLRPKGRRSASEVTVPWGWVYLAAADRQAQQAKPSKKKVTRGRIR